MSGEPQPESLDVIVGGKQRTITIETNVFCPKTVRELIAIQRKKVKADLEELKTLRDILPDETYKEQADSVMFLWNEVKDGNPTAALRCSQTLEGLEVILLNSCPEVTGPEDAKAVLNAMNSYIEILDIIGRVQKDVEEASGNSLPPETEGDEEKTE